MKEAYGKWLGRAKKYGDYMCSWILSENIDKIIVCSMIHHANETKHKIMHWTNNCNRIFKRLIKWGGVLSHPINIYKNKIVLNDKQ